MIYENIKTRNFKKTPLINEQHYKDKNIIINQLFIETPNTPNTLIGIIHLSEKIIIGKVKIDPIQSLFHAKFIKMSYSFKMFSEGTIITENVFIESGLFFNSKYPYQYDQKN